MRFNKFHLVLIGSLLVYLACSAFDLDESLRSGTEDQQVFQYSQDKLVLDRARGVVTLNGNPYTGVSITRYDNDSLSTLIEYRDGKKHGKMQKWFVTGLKSYEALYQNGKLNGTSYSWWVNGNLRSASTFAMGIPHGVQLQYYKSGAKFKRLNLVDGVEKGLQQSWRENGKLYNNYEAVNGRVFGLKRSKLCFNLEDGAFEK